MRDLHVPHLTHHVLRFTLPVSPAHHCQCPWHHHSVEPVAEPRDREVPGPDVPHELPAEPLLEAVHPPQRVRLVQHVRRTPHIIDGAALLPRPLHRLPLEQVIGHLLAVDGTGCPVHVPRPPCKAEDEHHRHRLHPPPRPPRSGGEFGNQRLCQSRLDESPPGVVIVGFGPDDEAVAGRGLGVHLVQQR